MYIYIYIYNRVKPLEAVHDLGHGRAFLREILRVDNICHKRHADNQRHGRLHQLVIKVNLQPVLQLADPPNAALRHLVMLNDCYLNARLELLAPPLPLLEGEGIQGEDMPGVIPLATCVQLHAPELRLFPARHCQTERLSCVCVCVCVYSVCVFMCVFVCVGVWVGG